jgi:SAM-dependent MidA family methyltransferase
VDKELAGGAEIISDMKREQLQASLRSGLEYRQTQNLAMKVHRNVSPQLLGKLFKRLRKIRAEIISGCFDGRFCADFGIPFVN